jgi:hypothetical protein
LTRVSRVRFFSPTRWPLAAAVGILSTAFVIAGIRALPDRPVDAGVMAVLVVLMAWIMYFEAWMMETRPEGLYIRYTLGNSRLIPYDRITRIAVRIDRLQIHTTNKFSAEAAIAIRRYLPSRKDGPDQLVAAITGAAHLTKSSKAFFGWPTYDREL